MQQRAILLLASIASIAGLLLLGIALRHLPQPATLELRGIVLSSRPAGSRYVLQIKPERLPILAEEPMPFGEQVCAYGRLGQWKGQVEFIAHKLTPC